MKKRKEFLSYGKQWIYDEDIEEVVKALKSDYLTTGPAILECEKSLCKYIGCKYAVLFSSGTAALHGAMFSIDIKEGDEVILPAMSFAATANVVKYLGGIPVFADIDKETYTITKETVEPLINKKTKAIIPVHYTGQPCDLDELNQLCDKYKLKLVEDGAHALGAKYKGKLLKSFRDMMMVSFHPVKHITSGEGGVIFTDNKEYYNKLIQFRSHGITRDNDFLENKENAAYYYEQQFLGYNYRLTDFQAVLLKSQLKHLDFFLSKRRKLANEYFLALKDFEEIVCPFQADYGESSYHLFVINLKDKYKDQRDFIFNEMKKRNIGVNVHYIPIYYHPYYKKLGYKKGLCKNTERLYEGLITLPLHPKMEKEDVLEVSQILRECLDLVK